LNRSQPTRIASGVAFIYQHATTEADARIADSLDADIAGPIAGGGPEADEFGGGVVLPFG
jgi:hypothetical protein